MLDNILIKEVVTPIGIVLGSVLVYLALSTTLKRVLKLKLVKTDPRKAKTLSSLINSIVKYFVAIVALLMILEVYGIDTKSLIASLGVFTLVIGLALQDILKDFIAGIFIIFENQYGIGDTITVDQFKGEVIALGLKTTKLKAYTGEIKIISNRMITEVVNHSLDSSLAIASVGVSYDTDIEKLEQVLTELARHLTKSLPDLRGKVEIWGIDSLDDSAMIVKLAVETVPMKHVAVKREMLKQIKLCFDKEGIIIPYPQLVITHE